MSNDDARKKRLREVFAPGSLISLRERAERLALLHLESGTQLSDESIEVMAAALLFHLACNIPQAAMSLARHQDILRGGALFEELRREPKPVLPPLQAVCTECGQSLPHESACSASIDPEAVS